MIVIYGPYPYPGSLQDGWMGRINAVDQIFAEHERVYVWPHGVRWRADAQDYRVEVNEVAPRARSFEMDLRYSNHARHLASLIDEAEFVYAHTSHSSQHLLPFYHTGKIITDLHGLAPEEEVMQGNPGRAAFYGGLEESMVRGSARIVVVTEAMADHFRAKYPGLETQHILLPIVDEIPAQERRPNDGPLRVVYSGGIQSWQNVGRMLQSIVDAPRQVRFSFYTRDVAAVRLRAEQLGIADRMTIEMLDREQLLQAYADADLGFVVRSDSPVNRVSCPTKLSEYLATGVVPIVDLVELGDFARLGYRYVTIDDFDAGRIPAQAELEEMRRVNRQAFARMHDTFEAGRATLRSLQLGAPEHVGYGPLQMTSIERSTIYPFVEAYVELLRDDGTHYVSLEDIVTPFVDVELDLPGTGPLRSLRLILGRQPLLITPIELTVISSGGKQTPIALDAEARTDRFGNWCVPRFEDAIEALELDVGAPERLRLRFELILAGHEALGVSRPEAGSFLTHLRELDRLGRQRLRYLYWRWRRRGQRPAPAVVQHDPSEPGDPTGSSNRG